MSRLNFDGLLIIDVYVLRSLIEGQTNVNTISLETGFGEDRVGIACRALRQRGLLQSVGKAYRLTDQEQTIAWFQRNRPQALPERLRR